MIDPEVCDAGKTATTFAVASNLHSRATCDKSVTL